MNTQPGFSFSVCFTVAMLVGIALSPGLDAQPTQAQERFLRVLDGVMPLEHDPPHVSYLRARMVHGLYAEFPEFWFEISSEWPGLPQLTEIRVRTPLAMSVSDQMTRIHPDPPDVGVEELSRLIQFREWILTPETCPELTHRPHHLPPHSNPKMPSLFLHPFRLNIAFDVTAVRGALEIIDWDQPPALWILQVREILEGCVLGLDNQAFFRTLWWRGLSSGRREEIHAFITEHLQENETYHLSETVRADLDPDGQVDVVFLFRRIKGEDGHRLEDQGEVSIGLLPGSGGTVEPFVLGGARVRPKIVFIEDGILRLEIEEFEEWPISSPDAPSTITEREVRLRNGRLEEL